MKKPAPSWWSDAREIHSMLERIMLDEGFDLVGAVNTFIFRACGDYNLSPYQIADMATSCAAWIIEKTNEETK